MTLDFVILAATTAVIRANVSVTDKIQNDDEVVRNTAPITKRYKRYFYAKRIK